MRVAKLVKEDVLYQANIQYVNTVVSDQNIMCHVLSSECQYGLA